MKKRIRHNFIIINYKKKSHGYTAAVTVKKTLACWEISGYPLIGQTDIGER